MTDQKQQAQREEERIVRVASKDIEGGMSIYSGLTKIKGISWGLSNAICRKLNIEKRRRIGSLKSEEVEKINSFVKDLEVPSHLMNRRKDLESGENKHLLGTDLDLRKEFDIKRLKKMKSYRGFRHLSKLPLRGQRTKGNFRPNKKKGAGIRKKK